MDILDILDSSEDEDFVPVIYRRPKIINIRPSYFEIYHEREFVQRFRLSKVSVLQVLRQIEEEISHATQQ